MASTLLVLLACLIASSHAFMDSCSQYKDCDICLNISAVPGSNERDYCGWCHIPVTFQDGSAGWNCIDSRDRPNHCGDVYETYYCTLGYLCNFTSGTCQKTTIPGAGYGNISSCQEHCFPTPTVYKCNTVDYTCQVCADQTDPACQSQAQACNNCQQPKELFKCVKNSTNASSSFFETQGECQICDGSEPPSANCSTFTTACANCNTPPPPPPTPPTPPTPPPMPTPPPPPTQKYTCNNQTHVCEKAAAGIIIEACSALCSNSTPPELTGTTWRGIEIQKGFVFGEWDYNFTTDSVIIRDPMMNVVHGSVSMNINMIITLTDGPNIGKTITLIYPDISMGPETTSKAFCLSDYNGPAPTDVASAMLATNNERVHALTKCNAWSGKCDFSHVFDAAHRIPATYSRFTGLAQAFQGASKLYRAQGHTTLKRKNAVSLPVNHPADPCNQFLTCTTCVAHRTSDLACGWCTDATIVYNDTGDSGMKCGGFVPGSKPDFTCAKGYTTEDCTGYTCNYTSTEPTCELTINGQFSTLDLCQQTCKTAEYAKCNTTTKTCSPCTVGTPGCQFTKDECDASCSIQRQKCNFTTKTCSNCDPSTDPNCTASAGECGPACKNQNFGICNPLTGICAPCDPSGGAPGCLDQCSATCVRSLNFQCNNQTGQCVPGQGNQTLADCAAHCTSPQPQPNATTYGCNYTDPKAPTCQTGLGTGNLSTCLVNCHLVQFAKCNPLNGACEVCVQGTPGCLYTADYCKASCKKTDLYGVFRGIQINKGFKVTEWDFTFYPDGKAAFRSTTDLTQIYEALYSSSGTTKQGLPISMLITSAPVGGPLPLNARDSISGMTIVSTSYTGLTKFLYMGLGLPGSAATTFDDAMDKLEFVLITCADSTGASGCNFEVARVPE